MLRFAIGIIFLTSQVFALKYADCGSRTGRIINLRIKGCEDTDVCELKRGGTYTYGMTFESLKDSQSLQTHVTAIVGGKSYPVHHPNTNTCEAEDIECPIESGKTYDFENTFQVHENCPPMQLHVKWELKDDDQENVICGIFPMRIN